MVRAGFPLNTPVRSNASVLIVEPTVGLDASQPSVDAPLGSTPNSENYIFRDGAMEPRPMLSLRGATPQPFGVTPIVGAYELVSVTNVRFPLVSSATRMAVYGQASTPNGWSLLSYVSSYGLNSPPALNAGEYWDFTQIYDALRDENLAIGAVGSYQSLYCTQSDTTIFSTLTGAPAAKYVASLDNYVLAFNMREGSADYVQRVRWPDRGSSSSWTGGLAGFEDLLSMRGEGKRVIVQDNQAILFSDEEIWRGIPQQTGPFIWSFAPYDTSVGCPFSWTITPTPLGLMFLGKDYQVYLLPKGGGSATPIGQKLHRAIRNTIDQPTRAWAVYDKTLGKYQLTYAVRGGSGNPQRSVYLDITTGSWEPQTYDPAGGSIAITRGCEITLSSSATTWGGLLAAGVRWADLNQTWAELGGTSQQQAVLVGSSAGTLYYLNSNATSDNGTPVPYFWQSTGIAGGDPTRQKTITELRVDYQGDSSSSLTIRFTSNLGASFDAGTRVALPAVSGMSQAIAYVYVAGRYPAWEIQGEGARHRIFRFHAQYRSGGR